MWNSDVESVKKTFRHCNFLTTLPSLENNVNGYYTIINKIFGKSNCQICFTNDYYKTLCRYFIHMVMFFKSGRVLTGVYVVYVHFTLNLYF